MLFLYWPKNTSWYGGRKFLKSFSRTTREFREFATEVYKRVSSSWKYTCFLGSTLNFQPKSFSGVTQTHPGNRNRLVLIIHALPRTYRQVKTNDFTRTEKKRREKRYRKWTAKEHIHVKKKQVCRCRKFTATSNVAAISFSLFWLIIVKIRGDKDYKITYDVTSF